MPNAVRKPKDLSLTQRRLHLAAAGLLLVFAVVNMIVAVKENRRG